LTRIIAPIASLLGYLVTFLYGIFDNYGIAIIVLTLIVRGCLFPIFASQIKGQMKMQTIQPKMAEIQRKYADDKAEQSRQLNKLYKEEKYNPMMGCLPLLLQIPIIWALFTLLRNPLPYIHGHEEMLLAAHESFLWMSDISQPDLWILPIAAGVVTYFSYALTQAPSNTPGTGAGAGMAGQMGMMTTMMKYFFPVTIVLMGRAFPAGLTLYWFVGTLFSVGQTILLRRVRAKEMSKLAAGQGSAKE
jgi:YidC/Oxa1 family membrane protein insertase